MATALYVKHMYRDHWCKCHLYSHRGRWGDQWPHPYVLCEWWGLWLLQLYSVRPCHLPANSAQGKRIGAHKHFSIDQTNLTLTHSKSNKNKFVNSGHFLMKLILKTYLNVSSYSFLSVFMFDRILSPCSFNPPHRSQSQTNTCIPAVSGGRHATAWTALWSSATCPTCRRETGCCLRTWGPTLWLPPPPSTASRSLTSTTSCPGPLGKWRNSSE